MLSDSPTLNSLRNVPWGTLKNIQQKIEITAPSQEGPLRKMPSYHYQAESLLSAPRLTILIRLGGGLLKASPESILATLKSEFSSQLSQIQPTPLQYVSACLDWLEQEQNDGILERCWVCLVLIVRIDERHLWIWRVGGNGLLAGEPNSLRFVSTDQRHAAMHRQLHSSPLGPRFATSDLSDNILPIFNLTTPNGYESFFIELDKDPLVVALNQSTLPFGPWPSPPLDVTELWSLDAGWKHGLAAHGVIIGEIEMDRVGWPHDLRIIDEGA